MKRQFVACVMVAVSLVAHGQSGGIELKDKALQAKTVAEVLSILGIPKPEIGNRILLEVPDIAIAGKKVPVKVLSKIPGTDWIAVLVDRNATPLVQVHDFSPGMDRSVTVDVDLAKTSRVRTVVRASGKYYEVAREVKVATVGCDKK